MNQIDKDGALLMNLLLLFQAAAMQHMGKIKNPMTDTIERDLEQAQFAIDTLDMMANKMEGNLTSDEERLLTSILKELKLNYVDEQSKPTPQPEEKKE
ncbi:MAG: DUF1844 domain-containing protein [Ignavibacteriales bacterium]|nr:DUF1844 domain-containing protein [Ignavibacteriales bacterium]